ncbi:UNVERIFIED_CONTAM: LacI family transcriptional regulator [Acetivibrio alkalicellulosi]
MKSEDIAKIVGVSRSTVSRVINNYPDIPSSTREKVLNAIREYNYYPNSSARRLAGIKNSTLGIFVVDIKDNENPHHVIKNDEALLYDNTFFAPFTNAFIDQANKTHYYVLVSTIYSTSELWKIHSAFHEKRIDGGVVIGSGKEDYKKILQQMKQNFILAAVDIEIESFNENKAIYINTNNHQAAYDTAKYLIELGHRNIGIVTGDLGKLSGKKRFDGFKQALYDYKLHLNDEYIGYGDFTEPSGYVAMKKILQSHNPPTAVFVSNDTMAVGAYTAISESKLKIPDDISIIGFDNIKISGYMSPPLTTVSVSLSDVARTTAELLIQSVEKGTLTPVQKIVNASIVKRESCKSKK